MDSISQMINKDGLRCLFLCARVVYLLRSILGKPELGYTQKEETGPLRRRIITWGGGGGVKVNWVTLSYLAVLTPPSSVSARLIGHEALHSCAVNCFLNWFPANVTFSGRAAHGTLLWLITRRLIDCLLICFYEKSLDKQFVQLEELSPRLSSANVWEHPSLHRSFTSTLLISIQAIHASGWKLN